MTQFDRDVNASWPSDLVPIDDAAEEFGLSRSTLYRLITKSATRRYKRPGDRKTYVSVEDIRKLVGFREV